MTHNIRQAAEADRSAIALCIAEGFARDFAALSTDNNKIAAAIAPGLHLDRFYVAEAGGDICGVLAISDCHGRAARVDRAALRKRLGLVKGLIGGLVLPGEFETPLDYPATTGYIEFVAVRKACQRRGIATALLKQSMAMSGYADFVLDVTDVNINAIRCYTALGFAEFKRVAEKHGKQKGYNEKIYMSYSIN